MESVLEEILEILGVKSPHYGISHRSIETNYKQRKMKSRIALDHWDNREVFQGGQYFVLLCFI